MTKIIAYLGLTVAALAVMLGQYWYTFGLWPRSWWSFAGFGFLAIILAILREQIQKED